MFVKAPEDIYGLVYDYDIDLPPGEKIKSYDVYVSGVLISGVYEDRLALWRAGSGDYVTTMVQSHELYNKDTIIVNVISGINEGIYDVHVDINTNRNNTLTKNVQMYIDEECFPTVYDDLEYTTQTDGKNLYILPRLNYEENGFRANTEISLTVYGTMSGVTNYPSGTDYKSWFTTCYCPLFTTVTAVRLTTGPVLDIFNDDTIYRYIHKNSIEAIDMYNGAHCTNLSYTHFGCDHKNVPYAFSQYVMYKSAYDLISLKELVGDGSGSSGANGPRSQEKTLGDLTIKYGGASGGSSSSSGTGALDYKRILYNEYMGFRRILALNPKSAVKGLYDSSKGYCHPVFEPKHNRIKKPMNPLDGPWHGGGI